MKLVYGFNLNNTRCKIQNVVFKQVDESKVDELAEVYLRGYINKEDIKNLTPDEQKKVKNFKGLNLTDERDGYKISAYVAYYIVVLLRNVNENPEIFEKSGFSLLYFSLLEKNC